MGHTLWSSRGGEWEMGKCGEWVSVVGAVGNKWVNVVR